eukprot:365615-Chlamydomonas_euryale.AAC.2
MDRPKHVPAWTAPEARERGKRDGGHGRGHAATPGHHDTMTLQHHDPWHHGIGPGGGGGRGSCGGGVRTFAMVARPRSCIVRPITSAFWSSALKRRLLPDCGYEKACRGTQAKVRSSTQAGKGIRHHASGLRRAHAGRKKLFWRHAGRKRHTVARRRAQTRACRVLQCRSI